MISYGVPWGVQTRPCRAQEAEMPGRGRPVLEAGAGADRLSVWPLEDRLAAGALMWNDGQKTIAQIAMSRDDAPCGQTRRHRGRAPRYIIHPMHVDCKHRAAQI